MSRAMSDFDGPSEKAVKAIRKVKEEAESLAIALKDVDAIAARIRNREDADTDAESALANAQVEAALAQGKISPADAAEAKAGIKAKGDRSKLDRRERDLNSSLFTSRQGADILSREKEFNEALAEDESLSRERRDKARKRVEIVKKELAVIDQEIDDAEAALKNIQLSRKTIDIEAGTEGVKAAELRRKAEQERIDDVTKAFEKGAPKPRNTAEFGGAFAFDPKLPMSFGGYNIKPKRQEGLTSGGLTSGGLTSGGLTSGGLGGSTFAPTDFEDAFKFKIDTRTRAQQSAGSGSLEQEARDLMNQDQQHGGGLQSVVQELMNTLRKEREKQERGIEIINQQIKNNRS